MKSNAIYLFLLLLSIPFCRYYEDPVAKAVKLGWEIMDKVDINGDSQDDVLLRNPYDCGISGCTYNLWTSNTSGYKLIFSHRSIECIAVDDKVQGYRGLDCIELLGWIQHQRVVIRYTWTGTKYFGELDHLEEVRQPAFCLSAIVLRTTPVLLFPANRVRVSQRSSTGWKVGSPQTPILRILQVGEKVNPIAEAQDRLGRCWLQLSDGGWVGAEITDCTKPAMDTNH